MSQEMELAEKDPNFTNPYKSMHKLKKSGYNYKNQNEDIKPAKKKKKKSFKKGPTLSRSYGDL